MSYNPCSPHTATLCPLMSVTPVHALGIIPVSPINIDGIPPIAFQIPDLEGFARLRIFANSTQTEIGCFQASMSNGNTFSQPQSVGSFVGVMVFLAILASFATAIYGVQVTAIRTHYAHSFSVLVIFETFQSMVLSGALSVNWPSVLPAWWSNFAWMSGIMAPNTLIYSLMAFTGNNRNISQVGDAGSATIDNGGGLAQQIYGRSLPDVPELQMAHLEQLERRVGPERVSPGPYSWNGVPQTPGMPMPGTWGGFGGTLSAENIPEAEVFFIALIWLLVVLAAIPVFIITVKLVLDLLIKMKWLKTDGFNFFRSHPWGYVAAAMLRTLFIAFFSMMVFTMHQFSMNGPPGPTAVAAVVWVLLVVGLGGFALYACYARLRHVNHEAGRGEAQLQSSQTRKMLPFVATERRERTRDEHQRPRWGGIPLLNRKHSDADAHRPSVHEDEAYIKRFGWLSARYRRRRWWFFAFYLCYQLIRASFLGGGSQTPLAQVYGLFVFEVLALLAIIKINPWESSRNTTVAVWMLSISKIATTGLSIAFLPSLNVNRIVATVLGVAIIVVQGFLALAVLVLICLGWFSTWYSLSRNHEDFQPSLDALRIKYYEHVEEKMRDLPPDPKVAQKAKEPKESPKPVEPYFSITSVRRAPRLEDEENDDDDFGEPDATEQLVAHDVGAVRRSRANSTSSRRSVSSLPRAARVHRTSWSSRDFAAWDVEMGQANSPRNWRHAEAIRRSGQWSEPGQAGVVNPTRQPLTPALEYPEDFVMAAPVAADNEGAGDGVHEEKVEEKKQDGIFTEEKVVPSPLSSPEMDRRGSDRL